MDTMTKEQRSYAMSRIRSKWTLQEKKIHNILKGRKIKHKMHPKMFGSPDMLIGDTKTAVFLDGCFWHGCPKCYIEPKTNRAYWIPKIRRNISRDREVKKRLKKEGYKIVRIWEHEIKNNFDCVIKDIIKHSRKKR